MTSHSKYLPFFEPGWGSLVRIGAWCVMFLWLSGHCVPKLPERIPLADAEAGTRVVPMLTIFDDHRTVREDIVPDPKKIHIAWISDSSGIIMPPDKRLTELPSQNYRTIPEHVAAELKKRHKMPDFDVPLYLRLGSRPLDNLVFSLQALKDKPDLIVMPVNHVWTFGPFQVINKTTSLSLAPMVWASHPGLWYMIPVFCSPLENLWALAGDSFAIIRYASPFKDYLEERYAGPLKALGMYTGPAPIILGVPLINIKFWIVMNILHGDVSKVLDSTGNLNAQLYYIQIISHGSPYDEDSFSTIAFQDMLEALKKSGVPVLIYEHPVSDFFYNNPETDWKIKETQSFLAKTNESLKGSNIRIISSIPEPVRKSIDFRKNDGYHAETDPVKFDDFLADQIWLMLKDNRKMKDSP